MRRTFFSLFRIALKSLFIVFRPCFIVCTRNTFWCKMHEQTGPRRISPSGCIFIFSNNELLATVDHNASISAHTQTVLLFSSLLFALLFSPLFACLFIQFVFRLFIRKDFEWEECTITHFALHRNACAQFSGRFIMRYVTVTLNIRSHCSILTCRWR